MLVNTAPRRWISQTQPTVPMPLEKIPSTTVTISGVSGGGIAGGPSSASAPQGGEHRAPSGTSSARRSGN